MEKKISAVTNNVSPFSCEGCALGSRLMAPPRLQSKLPSATGTSANFGPALSAHYLLAHGDARYPHPTPPIRPTTSPLYTPLDWATPSTIITPPSYPTLPQRRFSSLRHTDKYGKEDEGAIMFAESFSNLLSVSAMGPHHLGRVESVFGGDNVVSKWMEQDEVVGAGRLHGGEGRLSGGKGPKDAEQQKAAARMGGLAGGLARWEAEHPEESRAGKSKVSSSFSSLLVGLQLTFSNAGRLRGECGQARKNGRCIAQGYSLCTSAQPKSLVGLTRWRSADKDHCQGQNLQRLFQDRI